MRLGAVRGKRAVIAVIGVAGVCAATVVTLMSTIAGAAGGGTMLISVAAAGGFSDGDSFLSGSARQVDSVGRYVAFMSGSSDLVATADTNGLLDVFLRDNVTGTTQRVSLASDGGEPDGSSYSPSVSNDGRYVAFGSDASNLVAGGDSLGNSDVFVRDMTLGVTTRVSVNTSGLEPDAGSYQAAISADGQRITFASDATDLVVGDANGSTDVFVHYLSPTVQTVRVSSSAG